MKRSNFNRIGTAVLIGALIFILLLVTVQDVGMTWDEPAYVAASSSYMNWLDELFKSPKTALTAIEIAKYWSINSEHPPIDKVWSGFLWRATRNIADDLTAHRIGNMLLAAMLASLLYLWIRDEYGQIAGVAAVAALFTMPRFFFHAHLSSLDVPAAFSVFVVTYSFWKLRDRTKWGWGIFLGLIWGLALATKVNAVFIPITLGTWWLIFRRDLKLLLRLVLMGITAIPVFIAVWPWLYANTTERLAGYIGFITVNHWEIGQYYLGRFYMPPPWHFGFVMLWAVIPLGLTVLYLSGIITNLRGKKDHGLGWLLFLSGLTPIMAIALSKSLVYDNDRMYMAAFPFLAGLAGIGFGRLFSKVKEISRQWNRKGVSVAAMVTLVLVCFAPQVITMVRLYPHYLSYYSEGVGGVAGANKLGLETTYWCETYAIALPILNAQAKPNDKIWADPWSHDVLIYYQTQGRLRDDLIIVAPINVASILGPAAPTGVNIPMAAADWFIFEHRQSTLGAWQEKDLIARTLKGQELVFEYSYNQVPILTLYKAK